MLEPSRSSKVKGVLYIARLIANNIDENYCVNGDYYPKLTHKEVIALARIALSVGRIDWFGEDLSNTIECLLWSITTYGFTHHTRSFAAKKIVSLIETAIDKHEKKYGQPFPKEF